MSNSSPHIPLERWLDSKDILREYDQSIIDWLTIPMDVGNTHRFTRTELSSLPLSDLVSICKQRKIFSGDGVDIPPKEVLELIILNYQRVPIIIGSPSPQFAFQSFLMIGKPDAYKRKEIYYPLITVYRTGTDNDQSRFSLPMRRKIVWSNSRREVAQSKQPIPVKLSYQVDVLSTKISQLNELELSLQRIFGSGRANKIIVDHGSPWGKLPIFIDSVGSYTDQSDLEGVEDTENAEKVLRHIYTLSVDGWIPQEVMMVKTVLKAKTTVQDMSQPNIVYTQRSALVGETTVQQQVSNDNASTFVEESFVEEGYVE